MKQGWLDQHPITYMGIRGLTYGAVFGALYGTILAPVFGSIIGGFLGGFGGFAIGNVAAYSFTLLLPNRYTLGLAIGKPCGLSVVWWDLLLPLQA
jgi:hypothetical protein